MGGGFQRDCRWCHGARLYSLHGKLILFIIIIIIIDGPRSVVDIVNDYGLNGPGIESRWGRNFSHLSRPALGPTPSSIQCIPGLSWG